MNKNEQRVRFACYITNISMAVVANFTPLLFLTFRQEYGISFSLLGLLVLVNFCTQLSIDLIFSFFSHKFNIEKTVKITPLFTILGLLIFALIPLFFPNIAYVGLLIGTFIFAISGGLSEVLISPVIAALPSKNPDKDMSKLHSVYAWGVVATIGVAVLYMLLVGFEKWQYLALAFALIPFASFLLYAKSQIPKMQTPERVSGAVQQLKNKSLWLCVAAIFLGGASECTMSQWSSGFIEKALGIEKVWGDMFGVALFGLALGLGRTLYAKIGKNITKVLLLGGIGATACYLIAALSPFAWIGLLACPLTGFCVSMLWPGSLIVAQEKMPQGGVFIFAMMAAGGDSGASIGSQLVGVVIDGVIASERGGALASSLGLGIEQLAMKTGMLVGAIFPILSILIYAILHKDAKKRKKNAPLYAEIK